MQTEAKYLETWSEDGVPLSPYHACRNLITAKVIKNVISIWCKKRTLPVHWGSIWSLTLLAHKIQQSIHLVTARLLFYSENLVMLPGRKEMGNCLASLTATLQTDWIVVYFFRSSIYSLFVYFGIRLFAGWPLCNIVCEVHIWCQRTGSPKWRSCTCKCTYHLSLPLDDTCLTLYQSYPLAVAFDPHAVHLAVCVYCLHKQSIYFIAKVLLLAQCCLFCTRLSACYKLIVCCLQIWLATACL